MPIIVRGNTAAACCDYADPFLDQHPDDVEIDDALRQWRSDHTAVATAAIFNHRPLLFFFQRCRAERSEKWSDRLAGIFKSWIARVDHDLGDQSCDFLAQISLAELISQRALQHVTHASF